MKAWRTYGIGDMRLDEIPCPEVRPGWAVIKVRTLQLSITEVAMLRGDLLLRGSKTIAEVVKEKGPLQLFGHEFCGEVLEVGDNVENVKVGDRVFFHRTPCHGCALCRAGHEDYCLTGIEPGHSMPGCLAEYLALPSEAVVSIPDSVSDSEAAAMQPMEAATHFVWATRVEMGDTVVVLGQGIVGRNCMQVSRVWGAGKTIAVARRDESLALSRKLGADVVINASKTDPVEAVLEITNGVGADIVFECAGGGLKQGEPETLKQAISMVHNGGKIMEPSALPAGVMLPVAAIAKKRISYIGGPHSPGLIRYVIDLVTSKRVQPAPVVTHVFEGLDKVPEAFEITGNQAKYGAVSPAQVVVAD